jgi:hypothetical protein
MAGFNIFVSLTIQKPATQKKRPVAAANGPLNKVCAYATVSAR